MIGNVHFGFKHLAKVTTEMLYNIQINQSSNYLIKVKKEKCQENTTKYKEELMPNFSKRKSK